MSTLAQDNQQNTQQTDGDEVTIEMEMDQVDAGTTKPQQTRPSRNNLNVERSRTPNRRSPNRANDTSPRRDRRDIESAQKDAIPLLPTDINRPPTAQPESDEESPDDAGDYLPGTRNGVDDGFFPANRPEFELENGEKPGVVHQNGGFPNNWRGTVPQNFPYAPEFPGQIRPGDLPAVLPDVNVYQHKKTLAQGMMDLALLSANANQLRYVLESYQRHPYYYFSIVFIGLSLLFQVLVGIGLIWNSRYNVKDQKEICKADRINNYTVIGIFLITVVNVFVSAFGVAEPGVQPST